MSYTTDLGFEALGSLRQQPELVVDANMEKIAKILALGEGADVSIFKDQAAFWPLHEASGVRYDKVSNNHLTDNNTVTGAVGKRGPASQFTAPNSEYLSIADNAELSAGDIEFTIVAGVYFDSVPASSMGIAGKWTTAGFPRDYLLYKKADNKLEFIVSGDGTATTAVTTVSTVTTATWYFIAAWHDPAANKIYIQVNNGTPAEASHSGGIFDGTAAFELGRIDGGSYFDGRMERIRIFKRVLSDAERAFWYNGGKGDPLWV